jgi:hypothetical protein
MIKHAQQVAVSDVEAPSVVPEKNLRDLGIKLLAPPKES